MIRRFPVLAILLLGIFLAGCGIVIGATSTPTYPPLDLYSGDLTQWANDACNAIYYGVDDRVKAADIVVEGRWTYLPDDSSGRARIEVMQYIKGHGPATILVEHYHPGLTCNIRLEGFHGLFFLDEHFGTYEAHQDTEGDAIAFAKPADIATAMAASGQAPIIVTQDGTPEALGKVMAEAWATTFAAATAYPTDPAKQSDFLTRAAATIQARPGSETGTPTELTNEETSARMLTEWARVNCQREYGQKFGVSERVASAQIVVEGQFVNLPSKDGPWGASIQVSKYFKGNGPALIFVEDLYSSATCSIDLHTGVNYLFYIKINEFSGAYSAAQLTGGDAVAVADPWSISEAMVVVVHEPLIISLVETPEAPDKVMTEAWATTFAAATAYQANPAQQSDFLTQAVATMRAGSNSETGTPTPTP